MRVPWCPCSTHGGAPISELHLPTSTLNMGKLSLQVKANLENVTNLRPDGEDFRWYLKVRCANCGEETPDFVYLTLLDSHPLKGGRGSASMVLKCKLCSRENSIDILKDSIKSYNDEDCPGFKSIVTFECRGVEPTSFSPRNGFAAEGKDTATPFEVDLSEGDWSDFDEKNNEAVGVYEIESRIVKG